MTTMFQKELDEFLSCEAHQAPYDISNDLRQKIHSELNPPVPVVFSKLATSMLFAGGLTMLVCPQFGVGGNFGTWMMDIAMQYGMEACHFACGAFFSSVGILAALMILNSEEIKLLRKTRILQLGAVTALSLSLFICLGFTGFTTLEGFWLAGAFLGSLSFFELGTLARRQLLTVLS